jgi:serine/threonine-protein kinase
VNGVAKGTSSSLTLTVPPAAYTVTCKPSSGATKSRSVVVKPSQSAMALFKL